MECRNNNGYKNKRPYELIALGVLLLLLMAQLCYTPFSSTPDAHGYATVTVLNSGPEVVGIAIFLNGTVVTEICLDTEYEYRINIVDHNTMTDIQNVSVEVWFSADDEFDESAIKKYDYKFRYDEFETIDSVLHGKFSQIFPESGENSDVLGESRVTAEVFSGEGDWDFKVKLGKLNSKNFMFLKANVTDSGGLTSELVGGPFVVSKTLPLNITIESGGEVEAEEEISIGGLSFIQKITICSVRITCSV